MKYIWKLMLLPVLALPLLLTSCEEDRDSNPTLDLSHVGELFTLNVPANAANNTYDLASAETLTLTCSQPNYGGVPYAVRYYVQAALSQNFASFKELTTSFTACKMGVDARELNDSIVKMFQEANPDTDYPAEARPVYLRLRAMLDGTTLGECFSNIITLPNVLASYQAPQAELLDQVYVVGSSIQEAWSSWKVVPQVYGLAGNYYTMVYVPAGGMLKWGTFNNDWRGYDRLDAVNDNANAGISESNDGNSNIVFANGGWYGLLFKATIVGSSIRYELNIYPGAAYVIGAGAGGSWTDGDDAWAMTAPSDATGQWVSPAFTASGEMRAYIKIPGIDWWRTEFTLFGGNLIWRLVDIPNNWAESMGADYSVTVSPGQKLYVNFDYNTGEVK